MQKKNILFALKCVKPSGGALKVRHYFEHSMKHKSLNSLLFMPKDIDWNSSNPWFIYKDKIIPEIDWSIIDIVFISGWGWERFIPRKYHYTNNFKVIYLVQHPSKLMPSFKRYEDLKKPATRICVSKAMTDMANKIPQVNGPVITIPAGIEIKKLMRTSKKHKLIDILISGLKNPTMGEVLKSKFNQLDLKIKLLDKRMDRKTFIEYVSNSKIVVCLPNPLEGFYLPALEAMALNAFVVCPYAIGNDYCIDGINCFVPKYTEQDIYNKTKQIVSLTDKESKKMKKNAYITVKAHDITLEIKSFHMLLNSTIKET